jgi:hypothetical protein
LPNKNNPCFSGGYTTARLTRKFLRIYLKIDNLYGFPL